MTFAGATTDLNRQSRPGTLIALLAALAFFVLPVAFTPPSASNGRHGRSQEAVCMAQQTETAKQCLKERPDEAIVSRLERSWQFSMDVTDVKQLEGTWQVQTSSPGGSWRSGDLSGMIMKLYTGQLGKMLNMRLKSAPVLKISADGSVESETQLQWGMSSDAVTGSSDLSIVSRNVLHERPRSVRSSTLKIATPPLRFPRTLRVTYFDGDLLILRDTSAPNAPPDVLWRQGKAPVGPAPRETEELPPYRLRKDFATEAERSQELVQVETAAESAESLLEDEEDAEDDNDNEVTLGTALTAAQKGLRQAEESLNEDEEGIEDIVEKLVANYWGTGTVKTLSEEPEEVDTEKTLLQEVAKPEGATVPDSETQSSENIRSMLAEIRKLEQVLEQQATRAEQTRNDRQRLTAEAKGTERSLHDATLDSQAEVIKLKVIQQLSAKSQAIAEKHTSELADRERQVRAIEADVAAFEIRRSQNQLQTRLAEARLKTLKAQNKLLDQELHRVGNEEWSALPATRVAIEKAEGELKDVKEELKQLRWEKVYLRHKLESSLAELRGRSKKYQQAAGKDLEAQAQVEDQTRLAEDEQVQLKEAQAQEQTLNSQLERLRDKIEELEVSQKEDGKLASEVQETLGILGGVQKSVRGLQGRRFWPLR